MAIAYRVKCPRINSSSFFHLKILPLCHSEPFACHSDPECNEGEESRFSAQGKLREESDPKGHCEESLSKSSFATLRTSFRLLRLRLAMTFSSFLMICKYTIKLFRKEYYSLNK